MVGWNQAEPTGEEALYCRVFLLMISSWSNVLLKMRVSVNWYASSLAFDAVSFLRICTNVKVLSRSPLIRFSRFGSMTNPP